MYRKQSGSGETRLAGKFRTFSLSPRKTSQSKPFTPALLLGRIVSGAVPPSYAMVNLTWSLVDTAVSCAGGRPVVVGSCLVSSTLVPIPFTLAGAVCRQSEGIEAPLA